MKCLGESSSRPLDITVCASAAWRPAVRSGVVDSHLKLSYSINRIASTEAVR